MTPTNDSPWHSAGRSTPATPVERESWSRAVAMRLAAEDGLELTDEHWAVLHYLREHHERHGLSPNARTLLGALEVAFAVQGGRKHLRRLFPNGPVSQGCRLAGLPIPEHSVDRSFGTAF